MKFMHIKWATVDNRAYLALCLLHSAQILASLGLQIPASRYTQFRSLKLNCGGGEHEI